MPPGRWQRTELPTEALAGIALAGSLRAGARLAESCATQRSARPVIHPVAAAQTNPRLRSVGMLHGLYGDAGASALVYQRLQTSKSMHSARVISNRPHASTVQTCTKCVMHRSVITGVTAHLFKGNLLQTSEVLLLSNRGAMACINRSNASSKALTVALGSCRLTSSKAFS